MELREFTFSDLELTETGFTQNTILYLERYNYGYVFMSIMYINVTIYTLPI